MTLQEVIEAKLRDEQTIDDAVKMLNENINVPFVNEQTEAKHIRTAVNGVIDILLKVLFK